MGGLVCKKVSRGPVSDPLYATRNADEGCQALVIANEQERYNSILNATKAVFFFGTPHRGSAIADFVSKATILSSIPSTLLNTVFGTGQIRRDLIKTLGVDAIYLDQLTSSFKERAHNLDTIVTFYETKLIHNFMVSVLFCERLALGLHRYTSTLY